MSKICVLGSGTWGTAVSILLSEQGHKLCLWSYFEDEAARLKETRVHPFLPEKVLPKDIDISSNMGECASGADLIVIATPSHTVRQTAKTLNSVIEADQPIVNISKGLEEETLLCLSQVIREEVPDNPIVVMSGPSHAEEVAMGLPTTNVVASEDIIMAQQVQDIFMAPRFRVYTNSDVMGVELGGSIKNVIALCAGICDGLGFGDNTKAALMTRGLSEMSRLGSAMGAKAETFAGLSGIGDLIVTCTSKHSRNRQAGILIGQGLTLQQALEKVKMVVEGVRTTQAVYHLAKKHGVEMPIVEQAYAVLFGGVPPMEAVTNLMMRPRTHEAETINL